MIVEGNSGCMLELLDNNTIKKYTLDKNYSNRLEIQKNKQKYFFDHFKIKDINTPQIISSSRGSFTMNYLLYFQNFVSHLNGCDKFQIDNIVNTLINLIDNFIKTSKFKTVKFSIIENKYQSIDKKEYSKKLDNYFKIFDKNDIFIPTGFCHGDLTFSNILFFENKISLIDFLDTFIESPIQDMVKLRQDTKYLWSFNMCTNSFDKNKISIILDYIDKRLTNHFNTYNFYTKYYKLFQFLNFVRILPYCKNKNQKNFINLTIEHIMHYE
jgi:thiamine kinase-like enzyme